MYDNEHALLSNAILLFLRETAIDFENVRILHGVRLSQ